MSEKTVPDEDDGCDYCADHVPTEGYWRCPVCDAEWYEDDRPNHMERSPL